MARRMGAESVAWLDGRELVRPRSKWLLLHGPRGRVLLGGSDSGLSPSRSDGLCLDSSVERNVERTTDPGRRRLGHAPGYRNGPRTGW